MELNDLKSQLDHDVLQTRQLEETIGDQRRMEVRLEGRSELDSSHVCAFACHMWYLPQRTCTNADHLLDKCPPCFVESSSCMKTVHRQISHQRVMLLAQEQLEEAVQELEDLRIKHDALKAENATLLAERRSKSAGSPGDRAAADANGDTGAHRVPSAAEDAAAHPLGMAQLEVHSLWLQP